MKCCGDTKECFVLIPTTHSIKYMHFIFLNAYIVLLVCILLYGYFHCRKMNKFNSMRSLQVIIALLLAMIFRCYGNTTDNCTSELHVNRLIL